MFLVHYSSLKKERVSNLHHAATTSYRCYLPVLTEFRGSWLRRAYPQVPKIRLRRGKWQTKPHLNFILISSHKRRSNPLRADFLS